MEDEYEQHEIIHCPLRNCKGMLLQNPFKHEHKCSDCGRYWVSQVEWFEVTKN